MEVPKIFESEYRFCLILWEHEPIKSSELVKLCGEELGWKPTTVYTVIKRLSERGVLKNEDTLVTSLVSKDEVGAAVVVDGGSCYVRSLPGTDGKILGVVHRGDALPYAGETAENGWLKVVYQGGVAWISGKYGQLK